ncbi:MAG: CARDB domain-containing protein [Candidatus Aenigmatarchaeota archaeon]
MKAVSDVIAMLLMLVVTIGLVGLTYSYISGVFTTRTAVALNIDPSATTCIGNSVIIFVRNDGTQNAGTVNVTLYSPTGTSVGSCSINGIQSGGVSYCTITKPTGAGRYGIIVYTQGSSTSGQVYCVS